MYGALAPSPFRHRLIMPIWWPSAPATIWLRRNTTGETTHFHCTKPRLNFQPFLCVFSGEGSLQDCIKSYTRYIYSMLFALEELFSNVIRCLLILQWRRLAPEWRQRGSHPRRHGSSHYRSRRYQESHVLRIKTKGQVTHQSRCFLHFFSPQ